MKLPLPVILAAAVLVSGATGAGAVFMISKGGSPPKAKAKASDHHGEDEEEEEEAEPEMVFSLEETVVNLADKDELRYLKIAVALGLEKKDSEEHLKEHLPVMRDAVIGVLTRKTFDDLHTPEGVEKTKKEIRKAVNKHLKKLHVVQVYFEGFAMQ